MEGGDVLIKSGITSPSPTCMSKPTMTPTSAPTPVRVNNINIADKLTRLISEALLPPMFNIVFKIELTMSGMTSIFRSNK